MLLTADHGNIELMKDPETGEPFTAHTTFDVPIVIYGAAKGAKLENGRLADIAPTVLALMGMVLSIGGRDWRVLVGYGHSPEHVSLYCEDEDVMISGDMMLPKITTNVSVQAVEPLDG